MVKYLVMGGAVSAATLLPAGLTWWLAQAQAQPVVPVQCPQTPVWMQEFEFQELMQLNPQQYRSARVNVREGNVRDRAGFESNVAFTLPQNATVKVIGEAWDTGCNQWMRVRTDRGDFWMNGNILAYEEGESGPMPELQKVTTVCPKADWMEPFRLFELNALDPSQYRLAKVNIRNGANVREGAGFDSPVAFALPRDTTVTVMGEAWDGACNQWMKVNTDRGNFWMHGNTLAYGGFDPMLPAMLPPTATPEPDGWGVDPMVVELCPKAVWAEGYRINDLIPLAERQFHTALASENNTHLRNKAGFESDIVATVNNGEPMTVVGEAWDIGCNQWMRVEWNGQQFWVYGNQVRK
jgi:uncharacterized protein YgiM (DUF1202 family)